MGDPLAHPPLHSAEHLMNSLLETSLPGLSNRVARLKSRKGIIEFDHPTPLTQADIQPIIDAATAAIAADWPVVVSEIPQAEAGHLPNIEEFPAGLDTVRVVAIGPYPRACRGRHVAHTGEIQNFRVTLFTEVGPGRYRLNFAVD